MIDPSSGEGVQYYSPKEVLTRYPGEIRYTIILDTSEDIFPQSSAELVWFLQGLIIE